MSLSLDHIIRAVRPVVAGLAFAFPAAHPATQRIEYQYRAPVAEQNASSPLTIDYSFLKYAADLHVVRRGENLWAIAKRELPRGASADAIAKEVKSIVNYNVAHISRLAHDTKRIAHGHVARGADGLPGDELAPGDSLFIPKLTTNYVIPKAPGLFQIVPTLSAAPYHAQQSQQHQNHIVASSQKQKSTVPIIAFGALASISSLGIAAYMKRKKTDYVPIMYPSAVRLYLGMDEKRGDESPSISDICSQANLSKRSLYRLLHKYDCPTRREIRARTKDYLQRT